MTPERYEQLRDAASDVVRAWRADEPETPQSERMLRLERVVLSGGYVDRDLSRSAVASAPCAAHKTHSPAHLTIEFHHLIPVAWQLHTVVAPNLQPAPGPDTSGRGMLWDDRGALLCPTGHRNVHYWIVAVMHAIAKSKVEDPQAAFAAVKPKGRKPPPELGIALEALTRYQPFGSLLSLTAAGEWGQS